MSILKIVVPEGVDRIEMIDNEGISYAGLDLATKVAATEPKPSDFDKEMIDSLTSFKLESPPVTDSPRVESPRTVVDYEEWLLSKYEIADNVLNIRAKRVSEEDRKRILDATYKLVEEWSKRHDPNDKCDKEKRGTFEFQLALLLREADRKNLLDLSWKGVMRAMLEYTDLIGPEQRARSAGMPWEVFERD